MNVKRVWAVYFSATGTTREVVSRVAKATAAGLGVVHKTYVFALEARERVPAFAISDLVVPGTPVYAGRVPNLLVKYLTPVWVNGALVAPVVLFGNRNDDDAHIGLRDIREVNGFDTVAAGAFAGEHWFSYALGPGRPDKADMTVADSFSKRVVEKLGTIPDIHRPAPISVRSVPSPYRSRYWPLDHQGNPVDYRDIRPLASDGGNDGRHYAQSCLMGSISCDNISEYTGIYIRC